MCDAVGTKTCQVLMQAHTQIITYQRSIHKEPKAGDGIKKAPIAFHKLLSKSVSQTAEVGNTKGPSLRRAGMAQSRRMQCLICCHSISQEPICPKVESSLRTSFCLYKKVAALGKNLMDPIQNRFSQDWKAPLHAPDSLRATRHG